MVPSPLRVGAVVAVVAAVAAVVAVRGDGADRWSASFGPGTAPVATLDLPDGRDEFRVLADTDGTPNVVYFTPSQGGGSRLVAVGERGGWAVEPRIMRAGDRDIVYGATIADGVTVRVVTDRGTTSAATRQVLGGYRYFVLATDPGTHVRSTHDVTVLDRVGVLLGRAHDNTGTPDAPDIGAYDGRWDREHVPDPDG